MRSNRLKGYRVVRVGGKVRVEEIPGYGRDASAKIRAKKSTRVTPLRSGELVFLNLAKGKA